MPTVEVRNLKCDLPPTPNQKTGKTRRNQPTSMFRLFGAYTDIYIYIHIYIHICIRLYLYLYLHLYLPIYLSTYLSINLSIHLSIDLSIYLSIYLFIYIYISIYIYIYTSSLFQLSGICRIFSLRPKIWPGGGIPGGPGGIGLGHPKTAPPGAHVRTALLFGTEELQTNRDEHVRKVHTNADICIYICVYTHTFVRIYQSINININLSIHIYIYICALVYTRACVVHTCE